MPDFTYSDLTKIIQNLIRHSAKNKKSDEKGGNYCDLGQQAHPYPPEMTNFATKDSQVTTSLITVFNGINSSNMPFVMHITPANKNDPLGN